MDHRRSQGAQWVHLHPQGGEKKLLGVIYREILLSKGFGLLFFKMSRFIIDKNIVIASSLIQFNVIKKL